jgi:hypothetical protein
MIEHVTELEWPESYDALYKLTAKYIQESDNYKEDTSEDNILTIGTEPGGYYYIETNRWAFDNLDEFVQLLQDFINKVKFISESKPN